MTVCNSVPYPKLGAIRIVDDMWGSRPLPKFMVRPHAINGRQHRVSSSCDQRKLFVAVLRLYIAEVCTMRTVAVFMTLICRAIRRALRLSPLKKAALAVAGVTAVV